MRKYGVRLDNNNRKQGLIAYQIHNLSFSYGALDFTNPKAKSIPLNFLQGFDTLGRSGNKTEVNL